MKKSSKLSLLTAGIAGTLLATSVASVALTACTTQTTAPDSSQEQSNWFETQIDWTKPETYSKLYKDNQGVYYTSSAMTTVVAVDNTPVADGKNRAFSGTEIVLPDSVITISGYMEMVNGVATPKGAFEGLTTLKTIKLGNNVKTIGAQSFKDCPLIQEINLPTTTTNIGSFAFSGCEKLDTINLSNITTIGTQAFANTLALKTLNFGDKPKINKIGNSAFASSGLNSKLDLSTATNLYEIGSYAFSDTGLTEVVLPSNLTSLDAGVFQDCTKLSTVSLDKTQVKIIKPSTFQGCIELKNVSFPNKLLSIGEDAFNNAKKLEKLDLSNTDINTFGNNSFQDTTMLKTIDLPNEDTLTVIGSGAFFNSGITRLAKKSVSEASVAITLPATVGKLGNSAFANSQITSFDMSAVTSKTLTTLPADFFNNATSLETVKLSNVIKTIGEDAFAGATNLKTIDLSNTVVETIGANAFKDATQLMTVTLPATATLKTIGNNAFTNSGLNTLGSKPSGNNATLTANKVELPTSVTTLGTGVFSDSGVVNVDLSKPTSTTMNTLPASTFERAVNLVSVTLINTLSTIGENAFKNATNLKTVTTPNQATSRAVVENKVQFGNNLKTIGNNAFGNSGITEVALSNSGLTEIATDVFSNASQLKTVVLPSGLKTIKNGAFNNNTLLDNVNFDKLSSLETIEDNNFSNSAISTVDLSTSTKLKGLDGENLFTNMSQLTTVKVPTSFNTLNDQSQLANSAGQGISDKVFTKQKDSDQVKLTLTTPSFTLTTDTTSIHQSEFLKEYSGELDLSKSSKLTTIEQNTFNNPSISKLILPGDNKISFDLGNVTPSTQAKDVAPIYWDVSSGKPDSLKEISYTAKATTKSSRNKRDVKIQSSQTSHKTVSTDALKTIVDVMNTYSGGPNDPRDNVLNLSKWEVQTKASNRGDRNSDPWIETDLTTDNGKIWTTNVLGDINSIGSSSSSSGSSVGSSTKIDITTWKTTYPTNKPLKKGSENNNHDYLNKPLDPSNIDTLYRKHNGIIWKLEYKNSTFTLTAPNAKLYKASSTNTTTKATEYKQVYFAEHTVYPPNTQQPKKIMKITVVIK